MADYTLTGQTYSAKDFADYGGQASPNLLNTRLGMVGFPDFLSPNKMRLLPSIRESIEILRALYAKGGQISRLIYKKAAYPITKIYYSVLTQITGTDKEEELEDKIIDKITKIMDEKIKIREHLIKIQIERDLSGNVAVFFYPSFRKYYKCRVCGARGPVKTLSKREYKQGKLVIDCPECGKPRSLELYDEYLSNWEEASDKNFIFLNENGLRIKENPFTGEQQIAYIPQYNESMAIRSLNDPFYIESTPQLFIDAIVRGKAIVFNPDKIAFFGGIPLKQLTGKFSVSRDHLMYYPRLVTALFDILAFNSDRYADLGFDLNVISPTEIIYASSASDSYSIDNLGLGAVKQAVKTAMTRTGDSPVKGIGLSPLPLGKIVLGDTPAVTAQYIVQRKRARLEELCSSIGVPAELILGGMQFAATSVALRNMENEINSDREDIINYLNNFVIKNLVDTYEIPPFEANMTDLRSVDDVQRLRLLMELASQYKISWDRVRAALGIRKEPRLKDIQESIRKDVKLEIFAELERMKAQMQTSLDQQRQAMNLQQEMMGPQVAGGGPEGMPPEAAQGGAMPPEAMQGQEAGPQGPIEMALQKAYQLGLSKGIPDEQMQQILSIVSQLIQMPQDKAQEAIAHFKQSVPQEAGLVEQFYGMVLQEVKAERNLNQPLPEQQEQRRENPV